MRSDSDFSTSEMLNATALFLSVVLLVYIYFRKYVRLLKLSRTFDGPPTLPLIGNAHKLIGKEPQEFFKQAEEWTKTHGEMFRVWLGLEFNILMSSVKGTEELLGSTELLDKAYQYNMLKPWLSEGLLVSEGRKWFARRKIITPGFHFKILEQFVDVFEKNASIMMDMLYRLEDRDSVDLYPFISKYALDTICGRKWYSRRKIITPTFYFNNLEKYVQVFDRQSFLLVEALKNLPDAEGVAINDYIALCALDVICGRKWFGRRKIITPAFHFRILEQYIGVFDAQSTQLIKTLSQYKLDDKVDLYTHITHCALDVICETAMGVSCNAQINSDSKYVQAVKTVSMVLHKRMFDVQYRYDFIFRLTNLARIQREAIKVIHDFTNGVIVARREELIRSQHGKSALNYADENDNSIGAKKKMAFLDILLQSQVDGQPLSNLDIQEEVDTFMFEGHDTTTSAITFCLYNLAMYPEAQKKCFEEICDVIGKDKSKPITYSDLNDLNYLELALKETLRLFPSVPLIGRKVIKECTINGKRIPAGTNIGISPLILGRKEEIFPQADKFIPERFDSSMIVGGDKLNPYSYIPFSAGPRNCIGQKFAMLEAKSVVSKVLRHFEVEMIPNQEEPILVAELILKTKNQLKFKLKPRVY